MKERYSVLQQFINCQQAISASKSFDAEAFFKEIDTNQNGHIGVDEMQALDYGFDEYYDFEAAIKFLNQDDNS